MIYTYSCRCSLSMYIFELLKFLNPSFVSFAYPIIIKTLYNPESNHWILGRIQWQTSKKGYQNFKVMKLWKKSFFFVWRWNVLTCLLYSCVQMIYTLEYLLIREKVKQSIFDTTLKFQHLKCCSILFQKPTHSTFEKSNNIEGFSIEIKFKTKVVRN